VWPITNNCCPAALFTALGRDVPFSVAGLGHGDRPHAPDEYLTLGSIGALMRFTPTYLDAWAACTATA
jgi:acetylornithine deacetylase/succinyl-diaminopimelate desuccinylase-like protein